MSVLKMALQVIPFVSPLTKLIIDNMTKSSIAIEVASAKDTNALQEEVEKQKIKMQFELQQARIT